MALIMQRGDKADIYRSNNVLHGGVLSMSHEYTIHTLRTAGKCYFVG
jgi:hypothetical protein